MKKYRCDGLGIEVGKSVMVRERTELLDSDIYTGEVIGYKYSEDDIPAKDEVLIVDGTGCIRCTFAHCVYATAENVLELRSEIVRKISKLEERESFLYRAIREQTVYLTHLTKDVNKNFNEIVNKSVKLSTVKREKQTVSSNIDKLYHTLEDVDDVLEEYGKDSYDGFYCESSTEEYVTTVSATIPNDFYITLD